MRTWSKLTSAVTEAAGNLAEALRKARSEVSLLLYIQLMHMLASISTDYKRIYFCLMLFILGAPPEVYSR